jgi:hypothetical protein
MTARGLIQHVQQDHNLSICIQKGPLCLGNESASDSNVLPPPAHSSTNAQEYMNTEKSKPSCCTTSSSDQSDQPIDLSMTCSNILGKAIVKCSEESCKITLETSRPSRETSRNDANIAHITANPDSSNSHSINSQSYFLKNIDSNALNNKYYNDKESDKSKENDKKQYKIKDTSKELSNNDGTNANTDSKPKLKLIDVLKESESERKKNDRIKSNLLQH